MKYVYAALFAAALLAGSCVRGEEICDCEEKPRCPKPAPKDCGGGGLLLVPGGEDCSCCEAVCPRRKGESCEGPHSLACDHGLICGEAGICTDDSVVSQGQLTALAASDDTLTLGWRGPSGYLVQYREVGDTSKPPGAWQRFEKLTESPESNITLDDLTSGRMYEARALLPGAIEADQGRSGGPEAVVRAEVGCDCSRPFFRMGTVKGDNACTERPMVEKPCCVLVVCADSQTNEGTSMVIPRMDDNSTMWTTTAAPTDSQKMKNMSESKTTCTHNNETRSVGEEFHDGCEHKCICEEGGKVTCKPRCKPIPQNISPKCVSVPDKDDICCTVVLCDVTLGDLETTPTQASSVDSKSTSEGTMSSATAENQDGCTHKGRSYAVGEEFHDGCLALCACSHTRQVECAPIQCPTDSGLDVLDPHCVTWEPVPMEPGENEGDTPTCCPEVRCKDNGSCEYAGERFDNFAEIPASIADGCSGHRCFCEFGNITCGGGGGPVKCPPVSAHPPLNLNCRNGVGAAILAHPPGDNCCLAWVCPENAHLPPIPAHESEFGRPPPPPPRFPEVPLHPQLHPQLHNVGVGSPQEEISVDAADVQPDSSVHLIFSLPSLFVGLHGQVEISYTDDPTKEDPTTWEGKEIVSTPGDLIETRRLEYTIPPFNGKSGLHPNKIYKIRIALLLRDLRNSPSSRIITIQTPSGNSGPTTQLPPQIEVDAELNIAEVNATWARFVWRKFNDFELQFIDGVQLRYKEIEGKVYSTTQLLHRATGSYTLEGLRPSSTYEVGLLLVPFPGQKTELIARENLHITTAAEKDPYGFDLKIKVDAVKSFSVEVSWSGVPYPEDKYINIFRVIYQSDSANTKGGEGSDGGTEGEERSSTFKVAKRDPSPSALVTGLKPGTRYRIWIEAYQTNGRIKKSDVKDIVTKPSSSSSTKQGKLEASVGEVGKESTDSSGDYYGGLVGVSILAALAIVAILVLLLMLLKRQGQAKKAAISTARKSESAYDNPTYKVEIQQETMDL